MLSNLLTFVPLSARLARGRGAANVARPCCAPALRALTKRHATALRAPAPVRPARGGSPALAGTKIGVAANAQVRAAQRFSARLAPRAAWRAYESAANADARRAPRGAQPSANAMSTDTKDRHAPPAPSGSTRAASASAPTHAAGVC